MTGERGWERLLATRDAFNCWYAEVTRGGREWNPTATLS